MKRKFHGVVSIIIILLAAGAVALYAISRPDGAIPGGNASLLKAQPAISVPGPVEMQTMARLSGRMTELQRPHATDQAPADLALLGYIPLSATGRVRPQVDTVHRDSRPYLLTFTFSAGQKRFCIIDGIFYRVGSQLPDEGRVVKIETRRVMVEKNGVSKWIAMSGSDLPGDLRTPPAVRNKRRGKGQ